MMQSNSYKLFIIILILSLTATTVFFSTSPQAKSVSLKKTSCQLPRRPHPRIFLDSERLTTLRTRTKDDSEEWRKLKNWCSTHLNDTGWQTTTDTRWQGGYRMSAFGQHIVNYALAYQVLKTSDPSLANTYGRHAVDLMNATLKNFSAGEELDGIIMIRQGEVYDRTINAAEKTALLPYYPQMTTAAYKEGYASRDICTSYALAYDWVYDLLSVSEKTKFTRMMYRWVDWMRGVRSAYNNGILRDGIRYHEDQAGDCTGINNCTTVTGKYTKAYALDSVANNFFSGHFLLATLVPLATYGDSSDATTYLSYARDTLWKNLVKPELTSPLGSKGGDSTEGWNYAGGWFRDLEALYALKHATGEDVFSGFDWPKELVNCYINVTNSSLKAVLNYGEITGNYGKAQPYQHVMLSPTYIVRKEYPADNAGKLGQYYLNHATFANYAPAWSRFLWTDPMAEEKDFSLSPLYYHAIGSGLVTMRSSWNAGPDTVFASVQLGGRMAPGVAHENYDQGNIFLHRGEDVLLAHQNMQRSSASHNTIVFNNADHHASNPPLTEPAIDRIENKEGYLYTRGNITNAWKRVWKADRCNLFVRNVLYIRPNYLIVYDTTQSNPAVGLVKDWYTNYVADPAIDTANNIISATVGESKIFTKTLYPLNGTLTKTAPATGYWRVKFTPTALQEYDQFLHVIEATAASSQNMTPVERIQSTDGKMIGAFIQDPNKPTVVFFSADKNGRDVTGDISYILPPGQ